MSDVGGVGGSSRQQFRDDEIDAMRKDESTSAIVNKARRDAGFKESDVAVRGDDRTLKEVLHDHHGEISRGEAACGVIDGIHVLEAVGVGEHAIKREEIAKLGVTMMRQDAAVKISDQFQLEDTSLAATLQLHCDQGMNAARTMIEGGSTKDAFLKANPEIAKRYAVDAAFHNGFDALSWAKEDSGKPGGDPTSYKAALESLNARDARYDAAQITYRM